MSSGVSQPSPSQPPLTWGSSFHLRFHCSTQSFKDLRAAGRPTGFGGELSKPNVFRKVRVDENIQASVSSLRLLPDSQVSGETWRQCRASSQLHSLIFRSLKRRRCSVLATAPRPQLLPGLSWLQHFTGPTTKPCSSPTGTPPPRPPFRLQPRTSASGRLLRLFRKCFPAGGSEAA